jgi:hypothetical protein
LAAILFGSFFSMASTEYNGKAPRSGGRSDARSLSGTLIVRRNEIRNFPPSIAMTFGYPSEEEQMSLQSIETESRGKLRNVLQLGVGFTWESDIS